MPSNEDTIASDLKMLPEAIVKDIVIHNDNELDSTFTLYPNPASTQITINADSKSYNLMEIKDISGRVIYTQSLLQNKTNIDVKNLVKGVYFMSLTSHITDKVLVKKFIKF